MNMSREEFAVASLLVDLIDPVNPPECDLFKLTDSQWWAIIGSKHLANMFEVYSALVAAKVPRPHRLLACPAGRSGHAGR